MTVVLDEGALLLPIIARARPHHVPTNGAGGVADAELDSQFFKDLVFSPARMIGTHAANEANVLARNLGPADLLGSRLPAPVEPTRKLRFLPM
ncbi:MAG: hypothetical protein GY906_30915 [bacterium]|nr:hypothetical protein [bacterium]